MTFLRLTSNGQEVLINPARVLALRPIHDGGTRIVSAPTSSGTEAYVMVEEDLDVVVGLLEKIGANIISPRD